MPALFADVDRPPAEVYPLLARFRPPPSLVVASGLGTHLYWLLAELTTDFRQCDAILAGLAKTLDGDKPTVAHSMRLPGTQNLKSGRGPCYLLKSEPERWYALSDFADYVATRRQVQPSHSMTSASLDDLAEEVTHILIADYGGYLKASGWMAALCPAGHVRDYPGKHFYYNECLHLGHCFGKHGQLLLKDLKLLLGRNRCHARCIQ